LQPVSSEILLRRIRGVLPIAGLQSAEEGGGVEEWRRTVEEAAVADALGFGDVDGRLVVSLGCPPG
jgi:hypothetical protein